MNKQDLAYKRTAFLFQGGGALGAFQVGIYESLHKAGYNLDWVCGVSIGAINAAIVAGNKPENRISKLKKFWNMISLPDYLGENLEWLNKFADLKRIYNYWHAQATLIYGQNGFFKPQLINPHFLFKSEPEKISFYDTSELHKTLEDLVDFDLLNSGITRVTLSAVRVDNGKHVLFDNKYQKIEPKHIMASGALPPGFPAVNIDGVAYWDGGLVNNTPLEIVFNDNPRMSTLCFMAQLFDPEGEIPTNLDEVMLRHKDIMYSSNYKRVIEEFCKIHDMRHAVSELYAMLPDNLKSNPKAKEFASLGCKTNMLLVRFHRHGLESDLSSKDYAFSAGAISECMELGRKQANKALKLSPWLNPLPENQATVLFDIGEH
jgi:NTE family protein